MTKLIKTVGEESVGMQNPLIKLVMIQFAAYTVFGMLGFAAWAITSSNNVSILEVIFGEYIRGHFVRWTAHFPFWGVFIFTSAILSFCAVWLLQSSRREGGYLGILSFLIGFVTNILLAQNILVHSLIGFLIGWTLLSPLAITWKNLKP